MVLFKPLNYTDMGEAERAAAFENEAESWAFRGCWLILRKESMRGEKDDGENG